MASTMQFLGVNLSGGEYGPTGSGALGTDYTYPSASEISYYASKGMNVLRVPLQLERLEPAQGGPLDQAQVADLRQVVSEAAAKGMDVVLDPHNYGNAWGNAIGSSATPDSSFATFWGDMATAFKGDPNVIFGLMNEPNTQSPGDWATADNAAIAAIRTAGATQEILVPGTDWTGAWTWESSGNAAAINPSTIHDPGNNDAFEVHQYLDSDGSGTNFSPVTDPNIGVSRLTGITQWAQQNGAKLFLGEFGAPGDQQSLTAMQNMLGYMQQNSSVWQGATYWAGGPWWGSYPMSIEPQNGQDAPQMSVLEQFAPGSTTPNSGSSAPTTAPPSAPAPTSSTPAPTTSTASQAPTGSSNQQASPAQIPSTPQSTSTSGQNSGQKTPGASTASNPTLPASSGSQANTALSSGATQATSPSSNSGGTNRLFTRGAQTSADFGKTPNAAAQNSYHPVERGYLGGWNGFLETGFTKLMGAVNTRM